MPIRLLFFSIAVLFVILGQRWSQYEIMLTGFGLACLVAGVGLGHVYDLHRQKLLEKVRKD